MQTCSPRFGRPGTGRADAGLHFGLRASVLEVVFENVNNEAKFCFWRAGGGERLSCCHVGGWGGGFQGFWAGGGGSRGDGATFVEWYIAHLLYSCLCMTVCLGPVPVHALLFHLFPLCRSPASGNSCPQLVETSSCSTAPPRFLAVPFPPVGRPTL